MSHKVSKRVNLVYPHVGLHYLQDVSPEVGSVKLLVGSRL